MGNIYMKIAIWNLTATIMEHIIQIRFFIIRYTYGLQNINMYY